MCAIALMACNSNNNLPPNVIETVEQRFEPNHPDSLGNVKKIIYLDTVANQKVAEKYFHDDNSLFMEYNYKNGKKDGVAKSFYPKTGLPWSLHTYKDGLLHGEYKTWFENGNIHMDGQYTKGTESGTWKIYNESGKISEEINFDKK